MQKYIAFLTLALCLAPLPRAGFPLASAQERAQDFAFPQAAVGDERALAEAMPALAAELLAVYAEPDRGRYLSTLFRLQTVAGRHAESVSSVRDLVELRRTTNPEGVLRVMPFELLVKAHVRRAADGVSLEEAFRREFRDAFGRLDDRVAADAIFWFDADLERARGDLRAALERQKGKDRIALADAIGLAMNYHFYEAFKVIVPLRPALAVEDDNRRYVVVRDLLVETPDGARLDTVVYRPRSVKTPLPTLLAFTIYVNEYNLGEARRTAAHGYAGVVAFTRGKGRSPGQAVPHKHDGEDARAVIEWIARQPWSDGRVGMFGGSYNGFTQWAAAKRLPKALKALMPSVTHVPGIDTPMQGNVFLNFMYPWGPYVTTVKELDEVNYGDRARWDGLFRTWYTTGQPYRALEQIDGKPNPVFREWLEHPGYDAYWQRLTPYGKEFARVDIPVLTTTGYFDGGQVGALYTFVEHTKHNPRAEHYYLIGPYDHGGAQGRPSDVIQGYTTDPVARINIRTLRYQWFDYVFKGAKKPDLLRDRVNYQVMGANEWKHAPSIAAMATESLRYHPSPERDGEFYRLSAAPPPADAAIAQTIDFTDRKDVDAVPTGVVDKQLDKGTGIALVTAPFDQPMEVSGLFSGRLDFVVNKKDVDLEVDLYELLPTGEYFALTLTPAYLWRASYAKDRTRRTLLVPGERQSIVFRSERMTSRRLQAGSRLLVVFAAVKSQYFQINYGTGKDVSDESVRDATEPLRISWLGTSYVDIPVRR